MRNCCIMQIYSGITRGRVLSGELYAQKVICTVIVCELQFRASHNYNKDNIYVHPNKYGGSE